MTQRPRLKLIAVCVATSIAAGITGAWAGAVLFSAPDNVRSSDRFTLATASNGFVSDVLGLNTVAEWSSQPVGTNLASGTVTTVNIAQGQSVAAGTTVYTVDLRPVVAAQGTVPAFRSLSKGDHGPDVSQLQSLLISMGYSKVRSTGLFDQVTQASVMSWQRSLAEPADGVVHAGDILFVPSLPARIRFDTKLLTPGAQIGPGTAVLDALSNVPAFTLPVTSEQGSLIQKGVTVEIDSPTTGAVWKAVIGPRKVLESDQVSIELLPKSGDSICGESCNEITVTGSSTLNSRVVIVPKTSGITIPAAAIRTTSTGSTFVLDQHGHRHVISILASAQGMSVVSKIPTGTRVRIAVVQG